MSEIFAGQLTAVANAVLAAFAIITAVLAGLAFRKQSREVSDQAEMLNLQRRQLEDQREATAEQAGVLKLQAAELRESLAERTRQAEQMHRSQAARVFLTEDPFKGRSDRSMATYGEFIGVGPRLPSVTATAHNTSDQPIYDAELYWHAGPAGHGGPNPEPLGTLLPGATHASTRDFPPGTNLEVSGAVLRFRDAAGTKWTRRPDGYLGEQQP